MTAHHNPPEKSWAPRTVPSGAAPTGRWYFVVTVLSIGLLAWVPFAHAASRLRRRSDVWFTVAYGAAMLVLVILVALVPTDPVTGEASEDDPISILGGLLALAIVAAACVQQNRLRWEVYGGVHRKERSPFPPAGHQQPMPSVPLGTDPAVAAVLAARERRDKARELVSSDPLMARELRIGRPDLRSDYDDGGLVDLNNAPASAIAEVCELDTDMAERIVEARSACGGFFAVDAVFTVVDVPPDAWEIIRDRAIVIPH